MVIPITEASPEPQPKPYLNLGAGRLILPYKPGTFFTQQADGRIEALSTGYGRPWHHALVDADIYSYPHWTNVDRNAAEGIDKVIDLFSYPWPLEDNAYGGALLAHLCEHIPHEVRSSRRPKVTSSSYLLGDIHKSAWISALDHEEWLRDCYQDGWFAFWSELYRVLESGAIVHVLSPYAWSQGAVTDPTHTRLITEHTFTHSLQPDPNSPFEYATGGINFKYLGHTFTVMTLNYDREFTIHPTDGEALKIHKQVLFEKALMTQVNCVYEIYCKLEVVK